MKLSNCGWIGVVVLICTVSLISCKFIGDDTTIAEIIDNENYVGVHKQSNNLYHIFIDDKGDRSYGWRNDHKTFIKKEIDSPSYIEDGRRVHWTEDGAYTDKDKEESPYLELTKKIYFNAIKNLNLTVRDVKNSNYKYRSYNKKDIDILLKQEIVSHTIKSKDEIKYVEISFDKEFRPIKVRITLASSKSKFVSTKEELEERAAGYTHWFSYINKGRFNKEFKEIKKMIYEWDKEYEEWLKENGDSF